MKPRRKKSIQTLWADVPVENKRDDQLGRAAFAATLAKSIRSMKGSESFVFGLCGPWGCGKSSVLRMVVRELQSVKGKTRPLIVTFNPWWFSGQEQLLSNFLSQLGAVLGRDDPGAGATRLGEQLNTLGKVLRPFGWIPGAAILKDVGEVIASGADAAKSLGERLVADIHKLRADIDTELAKSTRRIVIVMDDIDRLAASEIAQLFAIVKAVADFPNTVYLLSFDHSVVSAAIQDKLGLNGASYLEKIVQIHVDIPPPSGLMLQQMFLQQLDGLLLEGSVTARSKKDFGNLFHDGLKEFFKTPRSVKRLTNVLRVLFPGIAEEVYWPEFIAMTAIQVFIPNAYRVVRDNRDHFVGSVDGSWERSDREHERKFHEDWLAALTESDREIAKGLIKRLFPRVSNALGGPGYGPDWEATWKAELRVCSSDLFDRYFQFRVPEGAMSESEWRDFLTLLPTPNSAHSRIVDYCTQKGPTGSTSRAKEFLDKTLVFAKHGATVDQAKALFITLLRSGDVLISAKDEERSFLMTINNELRLEWALLQLLERVPEGGEREEWLEFSIGHAGLVPICRLLWFFGAEHGRFGERKNKLHEPPHVSEACVDRLIPVVLAEIRRAAADGSLASHPKSLAISRDWRTFDDTGAAQAWVTEAAKNDQTLVKFLFSAQSKTSSQSINDHVASEGLSAGADFLCTWFDGIELRERCLSLLDRNDAWQTDEAKAALQLVVKSIDENGNAFDPIRFLPRRTRDCENKEEDEDSCEDSGGDDDNEV
jgi:predicted KAP-like P-loop ATPase